MLSNFLPSSMKAIYLPLIVWLQQLISRSWQLNSLLLLLPLTLQAQDKEWDKTFGGENWDGLRAAQQTIDGGYILGGFSESGISADKTEASRGNEDMWVVKLDSAGNKSWDRTFGGNERDELYSLQQTSDGGYILGGRSSSGISGEKSEATRGVSDYWVIKLDAAGNIEWDRTLGGSEEDILQSIWQTSDGGYILGGHSWSGISGEKSESSRGFNDYWVVKLNTAGQKEWDRTLGGLDRELLTSLQQTSDGGYIMGGLSGSGVSGDKTEPSRGFEDELSYDYWVVKLNGTGEKEWDKTYGGIYDDELISLQQTSDGGFILGGYSGSESTGDKTEPNRGLEDFWIVKLDTLGNKEWDKTIGGDNEDFLRSLRQTSDGGYVLGGLSASGISGEKSEANRGEGDDLWVVKINTNGNKEWDRTFGGAADDGIASLEQTRDGGYILAGSSNSGIGGDKSENSRGNYDFWVVKISGEPTCVPPTPSITVIPTSNVYTGGDSSTIYLGYGPQEVRLLASGAERYEWITAAGLSSTTAPETVFTPIVAGTYTFTVTAYNSLCLSTASVTVKVVDARCGRWGKVRVCHNGRTLCLAPSAVKSHLRNHKNDRLGICGDEPAEDDEQTVTIPLKVFPNPFCGWTNVEFSLPVEGGYRLELYSANGKWLGVVAQGQGQEAELIKLELKGERLREGIYYLRLTTQDQVQTVRLVLKE